MVYLRLSRRKMYKYGEEISYEYDLLRVEDCESLQPFTCGNKQLDNHIHNDVIVDNEIVDEDGLYFVFKDKETKQIIAVAALATSGITYQIDSYMHVFPAIKIDVLAVDVKYQKLHYDAESEKAENKNEHYYFSDDILGTLIAHCRQISEEKALVKYIILYADKKAYRYYERNHFSDFKEFMVKEHNMEINENIPMYMQL